MFPFSKDTQNSLKKMNPEEINKYIQDILEKMLPGNMRGMMNPHDLMNSFQPSPAQQPTVNGINATTFETHDYVFVRIPINNEDWVKQVRIYHTSNQLIVERIPDYEDKHIITLPAIVKKKGSAANYKEGTLEIRIPKNIDMQFSEIDVNEL
jgi:HSP20 family molecular chaperone IbpA